jgi:hypothetical protein
MARRRRPPSQGWKTFLCNHADGIASMDLFLVPTISFRLLYGLLILQHGRRKLLWLAVTAHPSAEWLARQLTEAYGWQQAPRYIIRDRIVSIAVSLRAGFERWAYEIGRLQHTHRGRMDVRRADRIDPAEVSRPCGCVWRTASLLASEILSRITTTRPARTYLCRRTRLFPVLSRASVRPWPCQYWAGYTTNISEREFPTGTAAGRIYFSRT